MEGLIQQYCSIATSYPRDIILQYRQLSSVMAQLFASLSLPWYMTSSDSLFTLLTSTASQYITPSGYSCATESITINMSSDSDMDTPATPDSSDGKRTQNLSARTWLIILTKLDIYLIDTPGSSDDEVVIVETSEQASSTPSEPDQTPDAANESDKDYRKIFEDVS